MRTDGQSSCEIQIQLFGFGGSAPEGMRETGAAAQSAFRLAGMVFDSGNCAEPGIVLIFIDEQFQMMNFRQLLYIQQPFPELLAGGDIRVRKKQYDFASLIQQPFDTGGGAGGAADMEQQFFHLSFKKLI